MLNVFVELIWTNDILVLRNLCFLTCLWLYGIATEYNLSFQTNLKTFTVGTLDSVLSSFPERYFF